MVRIRPKRFPQGVPRKLQTHSAGPFRILSRVGANAYTLEVLSD